MLWNITRHNLNHLLILLFLLCLDLHYSCENVVSCVLDVIYRQLFRQLGIARRKAVIDHAPAAANAHDADTDFPQKNLLLSLIAWHTKGG